MPYSLDNLLSLRKWEISGESDVIVASHKLILERSSLEKFDRFEFSVCWGVFVCAGRPLLVGFDFSFREIRAGFLWRPCSICVPGVKMSSIADGQLDDFVTVGIDKQMLELDNSVSISIYADLAAQS